MAAASSLRLPASRVQQPDLFAVRPQCDQPGWLERYLDARRGWVFASSILLDIGRPETDDHKRWLRDLAAQSDCIISGRRGYRHARHATPEEVNHFKNSMRSQITQMGLRLLRIQRYVHKLIG